MLHEAAASQTEIHMSTQGPCAVLLLSKGNSTRGTCINSLDCRGGGGAFVSAAVVLVSLKLPHQAPRVRKLAMATVKIAGE